MTTLPRLSRLAGVAAIFAFAAGCPDDAVTASDRNIVRLLVGPDPATTIVGSTVVLSVKGYSETQRVLDLDPNFPTTWTSSDPSIATLSSGDFTGVTVIGVSPGTVTVVANSIDGLTGSAQVTITEPGVADGIVFSSTRDGNAEIYMLQAGGAKNLTRHPASDVTPSKQSNRIYFSSNRDGNSEIYSMNFDGSDVQRITDNPLPDHSPVMSSNGVLAWVREVTPGRGQIFTKSFDSEEEFNISNNQSSEITPAWHPNGNYLVFASDIDAKHGPGKYHEIYQMNADGSERKRLTFNDDGVDYYPSFSPDGLQIAFTSHRPENPTNPSDETCYFQALEVWIMGSLGLTSRNLTNHCRGDAWAAWSPNGIEIVFLSDRGAGTAYAWDLWKVSWLGGTPTRITTTGKEASPTW